MDDFKTPPGFNSGAFTVDSRSAAQVAPHKDFSVSNYSGTIFDCHVQRTLNHLSQTEMGAALTVPVPTGFK